MRISDMLGQYNRNVTNGSEELRSAQSAGKMASTISELETGSIFEGTVNSIKGGRVTLALSNGQMISARLDGKVSLNTGDSMFFQVRSNDGATVAIKPYTTESGISNPILLNALSAAGIPATERSVSMVDAMMREQMSIGKQSILDMVKILNNNPEVKVSTLVQMTKIGLPVSVDMAAQFENYMANQHAILGEVEQAIGQLAEALGSEDISAPEAFLLYSRVLDILQQDGLLGEDFQAQNGAAGENNGLPDGGAGETAAQQTALQQGGVSGETLGQQVCGRGSGRQRGAAGGTERCFRGIIPEYQWKYGGNCRESGADVIPDCGAGEWGGSSAAGGAGKCGQIRHRSCGAPVGGRSTNLRAVVRRKAAGKFKTAATEYSHLNRKYGAFCPARHGGRFCQHHAGGRGGQQGRGAADGGK